jgi:hypothetical protein
MSMFKVFGEEYFIDIDALESYIQIPKKETPKKRSSKKEEELPVDGMDEYTTISIVKYETIKLLLEIIMDENEPIDEVMAHKTSTNEITLPFKLSFNTLLNKKIITKY